MMRKARMVVLITVCCLSILAVLMSLATAAAQPQLGVMQVTGMRAYFSVDAISSMGKLRVVIELSGPGGQYNAFLLPNPDRLVVDIANVRMGDVAKTSLIQSNRLADTVRISQNQPDVVRVVVDLKTPIQEADYYVFPLKEDPGANRPWRIVIDIFTPPPPLFFDVELPGLAGKVIVLDPGHGGSDPGAIGPRKTMEKTITLKIAQELRKRLEAAGAKVIMTREKDVDCFAPNATAINELKARVNVARRNNAHLFVSIHNNAFTKRDSHGTSTYYYAKSPRDAKLAASIQAELVKQVRRKDLGVLKANFYVLKHTNMPAALVEVAYISNPAEEKLLRDPKFQRKAAAGIFNGIRKYFEAPLQLEEAKTWRNGSQ